MPSLAVVRAANAAALSTSYLPVGVFVGGTSGIGQGMAEAFARHTGGNAHIVIVGRNRAAAESIIAKLPKPTSPEAKHEFVQCDVSLMKNVAVTTKDLLSRIPKINFLVMSPGFFSSKGRDETEEGIDRKMAVHYYSRWKFTSDLVSRLVKATEQGEEARVVSVLAAGHGGPVNLNDFGLKKTFSLGTCAAETTTYNDLMIESFSDRYPSLSFIHAYPGVVRTALAANSHTLLMRIGSQIAYTLGYPFTISQDDCGEYMLHGMLTTAKKPGAYLIDKDGSDMGKPRYNSEEAEQKLWEHTVAETQVKA
uniref:NAD(P)-binding protein n=1 Tax=Moniliophthora roreri TaxID=221103 RepID=A0A0W0F1V1_MONRR